MLRFQSALRHAFRIEYGFKYLLTLCLTLIMGKKLTYSHVRSTLFARVQNRVVQDHLRIALNNVNGIYESRSP